MDEEKADRNGTLFSGEKILQQQISVARNELKNLRQQVRSLSFVQKKEMEKIQDALSKAPELLFGPTTTQMEATTSAKEESSECEGEATNNDAVTFPIIGIVSTWFGEKRGTPRQPGICRESQAKLALNKNVFSSPEHTLDGLESFSHMWLIFHFHRNNSTKIHAKVSPPRLNGGRVGVFGTRSPHRPAPLGLSLVKIEKIEDATIFFSGADVIDGTPVIDIKPYIPHYDSPWCLNQDTSLDEDESENSVSLREAAIGSSSDEEQAAALSSTPPSSSHCTLGSVTAREAPDGEEGILRTPTTTGVCPKITSADVRVPSWIDRPPVARLSVVFNDVAVMELIDASTSNPKDMVSAISSVLKEDPRSVYLRKRWSNHLYTFLICDLHITCKFDDGSQAVTVLHVRPMKKCEVCGDMPTSKTAKMSDDTPPEDVDISCMAADERNNAAEASLPTIVPEPESEEMTHTSELPLNTTDDSQNDDSENVPGTLIVPEETFSSSDRGEELSTRIRERDEATLTDEHACQLRQEEEMERVPAENCTLSNPLKAALVVKFEAVLQAAQNVASQELLLQQKGPILQ